MLIKLYQINILIEYIVFDTRILSSRFFYPQFLLSYLWPDFDRNFAKLVNFAKTSPKLHSPLFIPNHS